MISYDDLRQIGNNIADWTLLIGSVPMLFFAAHYSFTAPWWRSGLGRMFFFVGWALVVFGLVVLLSIFLGSEYHGRFLVRMVGYLLYAGATTSFYVTFLLERRSAVPQLPVNRKEAHTMTNETPETPGDTTIWYKNKRVWRTLFSTFLTALVVAPQIIAIVNDAWPAQWLTAVGAQVILLQGVITRIMAIDAVNKALAYIGLGSAPKEVLVDKKVS